MAVDSVQKLLDSLDFHPSCSTVFFKEFTLTLSELNLFFRNHTPGNCPDFFIIWFEPTDVKKAHKAFKHGHTIDFTSPNLNELRAIVTGSSDFTKDEKSDVLKESFELSHLLLKKVNTIFVTLGELGVMVTRRGTADEQLLHCKNEDTASSRLYPPPAVTTLASVSGAGDCFAAALAAGMLRGLSESECIASATAAAAMSIASLSTVPTDMKRENIPWNMKATYIPYK